MAPLPLVGDCGEGGIPSPWPDNDTSTTTSTMTTTTAKEGEGGGVAQDDLSALLYIVVTLLFYSMGIVVGIITYLKRERADMEEEKLFDMYLTMKRDPFNIYRQERVQQTARHLLKIEREKAERQRLASAAATNDAASDSGDSDNESRGDNKRCKHVKISDCVPKRAGTTRCPRGEGGSGESDGTVLYPLVLSTANMMVGSTTVCVPPLRVLNHPGEPLLGGELLRGGPVSKVGEYGERRGALPMGASCLHVRDPGRDTGRDSGRESARENGKDGTEAGQTHDVPSVLLVSGPVVSRPDCSPQLTQPTHHDGQHSDFHT